MSSGLPDPDVTRYLRQLQEQSDRIRRAMAQPEAVRAMRQLEEQSERIRKLTGPFGRDLLAAQLQVLTQRDFVDEIGLRPEGGEAMSTLATVREATAAWIEEAQSAAISPEAQPPPEDFGWVELLPTVVQLKLLMATMDVLSGLLC